MNEAFIRTAIHETGHYVAHLLNEDLFGHRHDKVERIYLEERSFDLEYKGVTEVINLGNDILEEEKLANLPQHLAVLVYGCYFQCLFYENKKADTGPLNSCFCLGIDTAHGNKDYQRFIEGLFSYGVEKHQIQHIIDYFENDYFDELKKDISDFNQIFDINFEDLSKREGDRVNFNIVELKQKITPFLKKHKNKYEKFISTIKEIIDWENRERVYIGTL